MVQLVLKDSHFVSLVPQFGKINQSGPYIQICRQMKLFKLYLFFIYLFLISKKKKNFIYF